MNPEAKKVLKEILKKEIFELTDFDLDFLRARRSYLTKEQIKIYTEVLTMSNAEKKRRAKKAEVLIESNELDADEMNRTAHPAEKKEQASYRELQAIAQEVGLKYFGVRDRKSVV